MNFKNKNFNSLFDRDTALLIESVELENCSFEHCGLSLTKRVKNRSVVRNARLKSCRVGGCDIGPAVIENVIVDGFETAELFIVWGALFKEVVIRGKCGKLKINHWIHHTERSEAIQGPFDVARRGFYESVDWALDIREARFKEFEVRGIPARLIRRDPESQLVVTRERASQYGWRERLSKSNQLWPFMIDLFLSDGDEDIILVAPLSAPKKKREKLLQELGELRDAGVALPE
jgi:hypothetical protein